MGDEVVPLYLKSMNLISKDYHSNKLSSKGFFDEITVQDFPIQRHKVCLHIPALDSLLGILVMLFLVPTPQEELDGRRNLNNTIICYFFKKINRY